jgi:hypothetical protein
MSFGTPRRVSLIATAVAASMLIGSQAVPASAAPAPTPASNSDQTWAALEQAIQPSDVFDGASAERDGVPTEVIDSFASGWAIGGRAVVNATIDQQEVADARRALRACVGKNRWDYTGLQVNVYANSCVTTQAIGMLTAGGGVAGAAAAIAAATGVGIPIAGGIAAGMAIALGTMTVCSAKGRGMVLHMIPPTPAVWCNAQ